LHFDASMKVGRSRRDRRATFQFVEPGKLEKAAFRQRLQTQCGEKKGATMLEEKQEMQRLARALAEPDAPVEKVRRPHLHTAMKKLRIVIIRVWHFGIENGY
jgi:hypothetical protein